jgi:predicted metal-dependent phosphoesterase TrpH
LIDLHAHTDESDGTFTPDQLVRSAAALGLEALGICDHDTFAGWERAVAPAERANLDLVCGVELSTRLRQKPGTRGKTVHLLGYFLSGPPPAAFAEWLKDLQEKRRDRNRRMVARLQSLGLDVTIGEVEALGRSLAGRPHFARILVGKGYVANLQEAFDQYLGESARGYVEREEPELAEAIGRIAAAGGLSSLAHPVRLGRNPAALEQLVASLREMGLAGIEVYHSDHGLSEVEFYLSLARRYGLAVTGGSDFHGENKPEVRLGTGLRGNLSIPRSLLDDLRVTA